MIGPEPNTDNSLNHHFPLKVEFKRTILEATQNQNLHYHCFEQTHRIDT